jgi:hypothetical protein
MIPAWFRCDGYLISSIVFLGAGNVNNEFLYSSGVMLVVDIIGSIIFNRVEQTFMDTV